MYPSQLYHISTAHERPHYVGRLLQGEVGIAGNTSLRSVTLTHSREEQAIVCNRRGRGLATTQPMQSKLVSSRGLELDALGHYICTE